jgi:hypothetical protein
MRGRGGAYKVVVGKHERKNPVGRPRHTWDNNIYMGLQEVGLGTLDWIDLAQDRDRWRNLLNAVINFRVP